MKSSMARSSADFDKHAKDMIFAQEVPPGVKQTAWWLYQHERNKVKATPYNDEKVLASVLAWMDEQRLFIETLKMGPTDEQRRRLQMLAEGMSQKQIAHALGQNVGTTRAYFTRLRARLGMDTLYQLMATAVERGWVKLKSKNDDRPRRRE
jgi:DNA-binding NarL/FixJ family response regulator